MNKIKYLSGVLGAFLLINMALVVGADGFETMASQKINLEKFLEGKAQNALDLLVGKGRSQISVSVDLSTEQIETVTFADNEPKPVSSRYAWENPYRHGNTDVLPGFTSEELNKSALVAPKDYSRRVAPKSDFVKQINAVMMLDSSLSEDMVKKAKATASRIVGLDTRRGDRIRVELVSLPKDLGDKLFPKAIHWKFFVLSVLVFAGLFVAFLAYKSISNIASAFMYIGGELKNFSSRSTNMASQTYERVTPSVFRQQSSKESQGLEQQLSPEFTRLMTVENVEKIAEFVKREDSQTAACLLALMPISLAQLVMERLSPERRALALREFGNPMIIEKAKHEDIMARLRSFMFGYVETRNRLRELILTADPSLQQEMLTNVSKMNADLARSIQAGLISEADLINLPDNEKLQIMTAISPEEAALALQGMENDVSRNLLAALPSGLRSRIAQSMTLNKYPDAQDVARSRQQLILEAYRFIRQRKHVKIEVQQKLEKGA